MSKGRPAGAGDTDRPSATSTSTQQPQAKKMEDNNSQPRPAPRSRSQLEQSRALGSEGFEVSPTSAVESIPPDSPANSSSRLSLNLAKYEFSRCTGAQISGTFHCFLLSLNMPPGHYTTADSTRQAWLDLLFGIWAPHTDHSGAVWRRLCGMYFALCFTNNACIA